MSRDLPELQKPKCAAEALPELRASVGARCRGGCQDRRAAATTATTAARDGSRVPVWKGGGSVNLTPEKDLARELRKIDRMAEDERFEAVHGPRPTAPAVACCVIYAVHSTVGDFRYHLEKLPNFALPILRKRIAMPANPRVFSTSKLEMIDAAIRKAHASLACPFCHARFHAAGFPSHSCRKAPETSVPVKSYANGARHLTQTEMAIARIKAGLPCSATLRRAVEMENRKAVQS